LMCFGSRQRALVAFLVAALMIPMDQVLVIGGLHFPMIRVLIIFGIIRILREKLSGKAKLFSGGMTGLDKWFLVFVAFTAVDGLRLWQTSGYVVFAVGILYSAAGIYFIWRFLVRDEDDVRRILRTLAFIMVGVAILMVSEHMMGRNVYYGFLGGAKANDFGAGIDARDGKIRATGVFAHTILA